MRLHRVVPDRAAAATCGATVRYAARTARPRLVRVACTYVQCGGRGVYVSTRGYMHMHMHMHMYMCMWRRLHDRAPHE
eukprot:scaffold69604_cov65-Phaeocystis_antarctica.AAC.3